MNVALLIIGLLAGAALAAAVLAARLKSTAARAHELERDLVRAEADLEHERALASERLKTLGDARDTFKALSAEAVQAGMAQLSELARAQLRSVQAEAKGELDKRQHAVEALVAPLKDQLGRVDAQLRNLDQERRESRGRLDEQ